MAENQTQSVVFTAIWIKYARATIRFARLFNISTCYSANNALDNNPITRGHYSTVSPRKHKYTRTSLFFVLSAPRRDLVYTHIACTSVYLRVVNTLIPMACKPTKPVLNVCERKEKY